MALSQLLLKKYTQKRSNKHPITVQKALMLVPKMVLLRASEGPWSLLALGVPLLTLFGLQYGIQMGSNGIPKWSHFGTYF